MTRPEKHVPVDPRLDAFDTEAKALAQAVAAGDPEARASAERWMGRPIAPGGLSDGDARSAVAAAYGVASWDRLALACAVCAAIRADALETLATVLAQHPALLHENARGTAHCNWGPPLSYAANLGRDRLVEWLLDHGATDIGHAFDRACLQGRIETARLLHARGARPRRGAVMGPAETQDAAGMEYLLSIGAEIADADGDPWAPVALVLETYCRDATGRGRCLECFARHGIALPDSPTMDFFRRRWDRLFDRLRDDPELGTRRFSHREIWPPSIGCHADPSLALHGTPLAGATLLHMAIDFDEIEFLEAWLGAGVDPDARAAVDEDGFGGHTALFGTAVSQARATGSSGGDRAAALLLDRGADPRARASLRKALRFHDDETEHVYRDVTAAQWGRAFHGRQWVDLAAVERIERAGG